MWMDRVCNPSPYKRAMLPAVSVQHECDTTQDGHMFIMCQSHVLNVSIIRPLYLCMHAHTEQYILAHLSQHHV